MAGHGLRGIEILRDQRRRHHERLSRVRKPLARARVRRKLLRRIEGGHARQVADRPSVFGVVEPAEDDAARVAGVRDRLGGEKRPQPLSQQVPFGIGRLLGVGRRHLAVVDNLGHPLPDLDLLPHVGGRAERGQVDVPLDRIAGMAFVAITGHERSDPRRKRRVGIVGFVGGPADARREAEQADGHNHGDPVAEHTTHRDARFLGLVPAIPAITGRQSFRCFTASARACFASPPAMILTSRRWAARVMSRTLADSACA